jgi:hypothetical protein
MVNDIRTVSSRVNFFDAHLDDGSSLVIVFHTDNPLTPDRPVEPFVTVHLDRPGLQPLSFESHSQVARFSVGTDGCGVRIGGNAFRGELTRTGGVR